MVRRISSLSEFETVFGNANASSFSINANFDAVANTWSLSALERSAPAPGQDFILYYSLSMYFQNGGDSCYVVSIGNFSDAGNTSAPYLAGLSALEREDEPTLIVFPDAAQNLSSPDYYRVCQDALKQCAQRGDRFTLIDAQETDTQDNTVAGSSPVERLRNSLGTDLAYGAAYTPYLDTSVVYATIDADVRIHGIVPYGGNGDAIATLESIEDTKPVLFSTIKAELNKQRVTLPPSGAIAGVYVRVDQNRGVWKAPANEGLNGVVGPARDIDDNEQETLNVDVVGGKSINAVRHFSGRGTLVWGARTLAGNDAEWRHISVRRFFNMLDESCRKSTEFVVFEQNEASTWSKVEAMLENYMQSLWRSGALQGSAEKDAYFVNVGLGKTMTQQDILDGRLVIEIGAAMVRPAEFIVLRIVHRLA